MLRFAVIVLALVLGTAHAQSWPTKPVRFIVPFAAGGSGDIVGRAIGARLTEAWGEQVLIDNKPGAAGAIGAAAAASVRPDGYTFLLADDSPLTITPHIRKGLPYDPLKDLVPVVAIAQIEFVLTVNPALPAHSLAELVALLKANPGKYSYASAGIGSIHQLAMEWLKQLAGVDMVHVPYKGSGQILPDVIAGVVPITYTGFAQTMPQVRAGRLRALAVGSARRVAAAPELPAIAETYPGFDGTTAWNLFAPAGTPPDIVQKLNAEVNRVLRIPQVAEQLSSNGLFPLGGSPEELARAMRTLHERWGKIVRAIGLKPE